jgi:type IV pilus assembly protein PilW
VDGAFVGSANQLLSFGGTYAKSEIDLVQLANFGVANTAFVSLLGNTAGNRPAVQLIGVGADATLFGYDMLRLDGTDAAQPLADGVADLRALYGIDSDNDGLIDAWVAPTAVGFTAAALTDGSLVAQQRVMSIMAVRIGLVLRSDRIEREDVAPASIALFTDLPAAVHHTHNIAAGDRRQRFRGVEFTVPLRNVMLAAR